MASKPIEPELDAAAGGNEQPPDKPFQGTSSEFDAQVFQWAWTSLEGWGTEVNGTRRNWNFDQRIQKAQYLAAMTVLDPFGIASRKQESEA